MPKPISYDNSTQLLTLDGIAIPIVDQTGPDIPLVCVDLLTYNQEAYIAQTIESILMQETNFKFVVVIGEDCSTDSTRAIVLKYQQQYPEKIIVKLPKHNLGMWYNETTNIALCNSKYIAWCEGDDYWTDPLKLQKQVDFLEDNPGFVLCFHKMEVMRIDGSIGPDFITNIPEEHQSIQDLAENGNYIHTPSVVYRNLLEEYPFEYYENSIADFFTYFMLSEYGLFKYLDETMAVYRHGVGTFSTKKKYNFAKANLDFYMALLSYLKDEKLKKIVLEKSKLSVSTFEHSIRRDFNFAFFVKKNVIGNLKTRFKSIFKR